MDIQKEFTKTYEILIGHKNNLINKIDQADNLNEKNNLINNLIDIDLKLKNHKKMIIENIIKKE